MKMECVVLAVVLMAGCDGGKRDRIRAAKLNAIISYEVDQARAEARAEARADMTQAILMAEPFYTQPHCPPVYRPR